MNTKLLSFSYVATKEILIGKNSWFNDSNNTDRGVNSMTKMDEIDKKIVELLKEDGRIAYSRIAEIIHMSRTSVRDRVNGMIQNGIILGFTVKVSSKAIGKPVAIFFDIEVVPRLLKNVAQKLAELDDITIVSQHTGMTGIHVHAFIENIEDISQFIDENILEIEGVKNVHSHILIKNYKTNAWLY